MTSIHSQVCKDVICFKGSKNHKETKCLRFRPARTTGVVHSGELAETEHEPAARTTLVVGFRPTAVQPQTVVVAPQLEDVRVAAGDGDLLHTHINPFI